MAQANIFSELDNLTEEKSMQFYFVSRKLTEPVPFTVSRKYHHWKLMVEIHQEDVVKVTSGGGNSVVRLEDSVANYRRCL